MAKWYFSGGTAWPVPEKSTENAAPTPGIDTKPAAPTPGIDRKTAAGRKKSV